MGTQIFYKNKEAEKKNALIEKINHMMGVSCDDLCIFFATEDSRNKEDYRPPFDNHYDLEGFYVNLDLTILPNPNPDEINCIMGKFYKHFIWFSKRICEGDDIHFAWVYSHELQHLKQNLKNPYLLIVAELLNYMNYKNPYRERPTELECELEAKKIVIDIWDKDKCDSFLKKMMEVSSYNEIRYGNLLGLDIKQIIDVERELQQIICKNKEECKQYQKQKQDDAVYIIDIDKLCYCNDPHIAIKSAVKKIDSNEVAC